MVSYPFQKEPKRLKWQPVNFSVVNPMRIWVTDGRGNALNLDDIGTAVNLFINKDEWIWVNLKYLNL